MDKRINYINTSNLSIKSSIYAQHSDWKLIDYIPNQVFISLICSDFSILSGSYVYSTNDYPRKHKLSNNNCIADIDYVVKNRTKVVIKNITTSDSDAIVLKINKLNVALGVVNVTKQFNTNF